MDEIMQIISNVGFPIFAFLLMYKNNRDISEKHQSEINSLTSVIERNTNAITQLSERIAGKE